MKITIGKLSSHIVENHSNLEKQQGLKVMCSVSGSAEKAMVVTDHVYWSKLD